MVYTYQTNPLDKIPGVYGRPPRQQFMLAVIAGTPSIAAVLVALRIYGRRRMRIALAWDDYLIVIATVLSLAVIWPSFELVLMLHYGHRLSTIRNKDRTIRDMDYYNKLQLAFNMVHGPVLPLIKASIMILLLRIGSVIDWVRRSIYVIFAFNAIACVIVMIQTLFACPQKEGNFFHTTVFGGLKCVNRNIGSIMYVFFTSANLLTDLLIFPIPVLMILRLQHAKPRTKFVTITSFALSGFVTALSAWRLKVSYAAVLFRRTNADWTYDITWCLNHAESGFGIMAACMPTLHHLFSHWMGWRKDGVTGLTPPADSSGNSDGVSAEKTHFSRTSVLTKGPSPRGSEGRLKGTRLQPMMGSRNSILEETYFSPVSSVSTRSLPNAENEKGLGVHAVSEETEVLPEAGGLGRLGNDERV